TGRPFVLLIYGDHQPWSFTTGLTSVAGGTNTLTGFMDYSSQRKAAGIDQTFFHLLASDKTVLNMAFSKPLPVLLLPTLTSAFVATSYEDLYLPANFVALDSCGFDIRAASCERYTEIANSWRETLLTTPDLKLHN